MTHNYFTLIHNAVGQFFPRNLKSKIEKETIEKDIVKQEDFSPGYSFNMTHDLTPAQQAVYDQIESSEQDKVLLYGITGSGKTEIYLKLIKKYLNE